MLLGVLFTPATSWAEKTDIVILTNGDRITGEIEKLEAGILRYKTDTMGTVSIEWRFIQTIITDQQQVIETADGQRWLGKLQKPEDGEDVQLITVRGPVQIDPQEVVSAWPVQATFWDKAELSVSVGYDYAKSTGITNFTGAADFLYRTDERLVDSTFRSDITQQDAADDQNRQEFRFNHQRFMEDLKFRSVLAGYESNDAIGLDSRLTAGGAFGRYLSKTNRNWLSMAGGLLVAREDSIEGERTDSIEGIVNARWRFFQYATPERVLDTNLNIFPSLTETGRWRADFRTTFKLELIVDLFWNMEFYANYDSDPIDVEAEKSDYGITTGFGYKF